MDNKIIVDTLRLAYQYLGKAVADGELANCAKPVESAFKQVGLVLSALDGETNNQLSPFGETISLSERESIARCLWSFKHNTDVSWEQVADFVQASYLAIADQVLAILPSLGYVKLPPDSAILEGISNLANIGDSQSE